MRTNKRICLAVLALIFVLAVLASAMPVLAFAKTEVQQSDCCESSKEAAPLFDQAPDDVFGDEFDEEEDEREPIYVDENIVTYLALGALAVFSFMVIIAILIALSRR